MHTPGPQILMHDGSIKPHLVMAIWPPGHLHAMQCSLEGSPRLGIGTHLAFKSLLGLPTSQDPANFPLLLSVSNRSLASP